ncbi:CehA/McbA family metallohydrolase [Actinoplanes octamycinicus]|nr:phosphoesterase [Actinoplanes octamycinicus]
MPGLRVVDYDPAWPDLAVAAITELERALPDVLVAIEHIGSTAVPGLAAKPIIDLMAAVPDLGIVHQREETLAGLGYRRHVNGMVDRLLYVRATDGDRTHILHVVTVESWPTRNQRMLRDHLRAHPDDAQRYARLKRELAAGGIAPGEYARAKTGLIQELTDRARAARGLPPVPVWEKTGARAERDGRGAGWFCGDLHVHTRCSHAGELTPAQVAAAAREAGLDFLAVTEHNNADSHGAWEPLAGDDLLVILGQEVVTASGHWLALGLDRGQVIDWRHDHRDGVDRVRRAGGLCVVAHPHAPYPSGTFEYPVERFDAVEVWNGRWTSDLPWNADNEAALADWGRDLAAAVRRGRWQPAIGDSDAHLHGQLGTPQTVVLAGELSADAVLAGVRAGRCWVAESADVRLSFTARAGDRGAGIGEVLDTGGEAVAAAVQVSGVPSGTVTFHTDRGVPHRHILPGTGSGSADWLTSAGESAFVRIEVRHPSGRMAALTNPIILI